MFKIKKIVDETPLVKTFFLDGFIDMAPGQFFMVWLPGIDEKPFTLSYVGKDPAISIRKNGKGTLAFHKLKIGDSIGLRGPYGKGFQKVKGKTAVVAGGIGMIALASIIESLDNPKIICGAKTKDEMIFKERFKMIPCSDDGSIGKKCYSPELFESILEKEKFDMVYTCGPEIMIKVVKDICKKYKIPMQGSLERYMKCGVGVCASCVCGNQLVCKDGPVFSGEQLDKMVDFGKSALLMSGKKASLKEFFEWKQ